MKVVLLVFMVVVVVLPNIRASTKFFMGHRVGGNVLPPDVLVPRSVSTNYFNQRLDHFNPTDTRTFSQKYYVNDDYFNATTDNIFLYIGGESAASLGWMSYGSWVDSAKEYGALLIMLEHRFYGESHPFNDTSTENLRYLSSQQAVEDLATFITAIKEQYNFTSDAKLIAFGGSYAGSLAAWLRLKYSHLVDGAMCSSGPLLALLDYHEYLQVVADDLATHSQDCVDNVQTAINQLEDLLSEGNYEQIENTFNLCESIEDGFNTSTKDVAIFFERIADDFAGVAQYNNLRSSGINIDYICDILTNETIGTELDRLGAVNKAINVSPDCLDHKYENLLAEFGNTTIDSSTMMRQWTYQTCTEFAFFQTSSQTVPVFGNRFPIDFFTDLCVDLYGTQFNETLTNTGINYMNTYYGAKDIAISNIVHVHGTFDPWYPLGITETVYDHSPAIFINGTAHCANLYENAEGDLEELVLARAEVHRLVGVWLGVLEDTSKAAHYISSLYLISTLALLCWYKIVDF